MAGRSDARIWCRLLGAAALLAAVGCNGGQTLGGAGSGGRGSGGAGSGGRGSGGAGSAGRGSGGAGSAGRGSGGAGSGGLSGLGGGAGGSAGRGVGGGVAGSTGGSGTVVSGRLSNSVDILFMIDNSSSMSEMQQKLYDQLPLFMNALTTLPHPPSLHVAVVSSDMGAPGDSTSSIMCTKFGDQGQFQSMPRGTCTATTLNPGDTFISDADGQPNSSDTIANVFRCIALLGDKGCGFENQLASIDRALGGDGQQPGTNSGFLRPEAYLGIVILTNEDDCSAPFNTQLYSLNGGQQNIANPLGPIANYRCNQWGHLCTDPGTGTVETPPLQPPSDTMMTGTTPTLDMTNCMSNDTGSGLLTPVSQFVRDIKALKGDDSQFLVAAISGPPTPYTVAWLPPSGGQNPQPGELWPTIEHSCGAAGGDDVNPEATMNTVDGSFGDPGVRIAQFVNAFPNSVLGSICDKSYAATMTAIATKIGRLVGPPCITGKIPTDAQGVPRCTVARNAGTVLIQSCLQTGNQAPCWSLTPGAETCTGQSLVLEESSPVEENASFSCSLCPPGATGNGC